MQLLSETRCPMIPNAATRCQKACGEACPVYSESRTDLVPNVDVQAGKSSARETKD